MTDPKKPEARDVLEFEKDSLTGALREKVNHTVSIKDFFKATTQGIRPLAGTQGYTPSGTAPLRMTKLNMLHPTAAVADIVFADRNGTIDRFILGTGVACNNVTQLNLKGSPKAPIMIVEGTLAAYSLGSLAAGSLSASWEGVRAPPTQ